MKSGLIDMKITKEEVFAKIREQGYEPTPDDEKTIGALLSSSPLGKLNDSKLESIAGGMSKGLKYALTAAGILTAVAAIGGTAYYLSSPSKKSSNFTAFGPDYGERSTHDYGGLADRVAVNSNGISVDISINGKTYKNVTRKQFGSLLSPYFTNAESDAVAAGIASGMEHNW